MSDLPIDVRSATVEDIPAIKKLLLDSWMEHARHEPTLLDEDRMRQSDVEAYYNKALENTDVFVFVAENNNRVIGVVRGDIQTIPSFFRHNRILFLDDIAVDANFRHRGVAHALAAQLEGVAKQHNIHRLQGRVYTFNIPAQKFLQKLGFTMPHSTWDKVI